MKYASIILASLLVVGCASDEKFTPGAPSNIQGSGIYFTSGYETQTVIGDEPTIEDTLWIELGRADNLVEVDVPIIVESKAECISVPSSVHFDEGETEAWLGLTYVGAEFGKESKFALRIDDEYANPYAEKQGSTRMESCILRSRWVDVCDTLIFSPNSAAWPNQGCRLQQLEGQRRLRFTDFLGSGKPLEFGLKSGWNDTDVRLSKGEFNPLTNYYEDGAYWYFTNGGNYEQWTPKGSSKTIDYIMFYVGNLYTFLDLQCDKSTSPTLKWGGREYYSDYNNHYSMMTAWIVYTDGTSGWEYIYLYPSYLKE